MVDAKDQKILDDLKHDLQTRVVTNVFNEDAFKEQFLIVFRTMSEVLASTLGTYGSTTMIDNGTNYSVTKDGFHVLANLRFADTKQNRIYTTLFNISHRMVAKVGDGSTTAVVAAYAFLNEMLTLCKDMEIRPKELNERINDIVKSICTLIGVNSTKITEDTLLETVDRIARIATNGNDEYSKLITDIYRQLGPNCDINISKSQTFENRVTFEEGVYSNDNYLVDSIYHNRGNECHLANCRVLMFDNSLEPDIFDFFAMAYNAYCQPNNSPLIIIAPFYDQYLMDKIRKDAETVIQRYSSVAMPRFPMVFIKSNLTKPIQKDMYRDLAALLGATIIQPPDVREITELLNNIGKEAVKAKTEKRPMDETDVNKLYAIVESHIGSCDEADLGDRKSAFKGFPTRNATLYDKMYHDAKVKLEAAEENALNNDTVDTDLYDAKTRFSKINCKSATIEVGGSNRLEMDMNYDAVDDAVKAVASAVKYGYNIGCNMAIINAIDVMLNSPDNKDKVNNQILKGLKEAFRHVFFTILTNGMNENAAREILNQCINDGVCYDMERKCYDAGINVINSSQTDMEILRGAIAMVGVVLTCNQYISTTLNH